MSNRKKQHVYILIDYRNTIDGQPTIIGVFSTKTAAIKRHHRNNAMSTNCAILKKAVIGTEVVSEASEKCNSALVEVFYS